MFWKKKKGKSEKEWYIKHLAGTDPCNLKREEIIKTMTLDQLKELSLINSNNHLSISQKGL